MSSSYNLIASPDPDYGNISEGTTIHTDINGDGLLNLVTGAPDDMLHVQLNLGLFQGFGPVFTMPGYLKSGLGFDCSQIWSDNGDTPPSVPAGQNTAPSADIITKWSRPTQDKFASPVS